MSDFGSSLFKIQSGLASLADLISVIGELYENPSTRDRAGGLGCFVRDMEEAHRRENCESMVVVFFAEFDPKLPRFPEQRIYMGTTKFIERCCPPKYCKWVDNVKADYDRKGKATRVVFSEEVAFTIKAIEDLWGVQGHLMRIGEV